MTRFALPCIVCGKRLQNVEEDCTNQPHEGCAFMAHGHYGSTSWDPMDGRYLEITVCDECLLAAGADGKVLLGQDTKLVSMPGPASIAHMPTVIGTTPVNRHLVQWDPEYQERDNEPMVQFDTFRELAEAIADGFVLQSRFKMTEIRQMYANVEGE